MIETALKQHSTSSKPPSKKSLDFFPSTFYIKKWYIYLYLYVYVTGEIKLFKIKKYIKKNKYEIKIKIP